MELATIGTRANLRINDRNVSKDFHGHDAGMHADQWLQAELSKYTANGFEMVGRHDYTGGYYTETYITSPAMPINFWNIIMLGTAPIYC